MTDRLRSREDAEGQLRHRISALVSGYQAANFSVDNREKPMTELRAWYANGAKKSDDVAPMHAANVSEYDRQLARLVSLLQPEAQWPRLVTVVGRTDTGKTALAAAAARALAGAYGGNVFSVCLTQATDPVQLPLLILAALQRPMDHECRPGADKGLVTRGTAPRRRGAGNPGNLIQPDAGTRLDQVARALPKCPSLLVLDQFEQILTDGHSPFACNALTLPDGAGMVGTLLSRAPQLKCLITSRRLLDLEDEYELPLFSPVALNPLDAKPRSLYTRFYG
jgi:hypothetical protein